MVSHQPPPTRYGTPTVQPKPAVHGAPQHCPPPTRYGTTTAQAKPTAHPAAAGPLPPPTRYGAALPAQGKPAFHSPAGGTHAPPPTRYGATAAQPRPAGPANLAAPAANSPRVPPPTRFAAKAVQPYQVLGPGALYAAMPVRRPWYGYPYAVVTGVQLPAQQRRDGVEGEGAFLADGDANTANIQNHAGGMSLRVSDDCRMAIEDSDLGQRQPKKFFLHADLLASANLALQGANSSIRLAPTADSITILTGWSSQQVLQGVTARYELHATPNDLPQNCNDIATRVSGNAMTTNHGSDQTLNARETLSGAVGGIMSEAQVRAYVRSHSNAGSRWNRALSRRHLNQFANPGIGESYMISTIDPSSRRQVVEEEIYHLNKRRNDLWWWERNRLAALRRELEGLPDDAPNMEAVQHVMDYETNENRALGWPYHFGGVVAKSGSDVVTLENYARGDNRQGGGDPRWYFQMYGQSKSGQSFHEAHKSQRAYSNPITVAVRRG